MIRRFLRWLLSPPLDYMDPHTRAFQQRINSYERQQRDFWHDEHC